MGVMADLSGDAKEPLPGVTERKFLAIDVDNFDERMKSMKPRAAFTVPNTLTGQGNLAVDKRYDGHVFFFLLLTSLSYVLLARRRRRRPGAGNDGGLRPAGGFDAPRAQSRASRSARAFSRSLRAGAVGAGRSAVGKRHTS